MLIEIGIIAFLLGSGDFINDSLIPEQKKKRKKTSRVGLVGLFYIRGPWTELQNYIQGRKAFSFSFSF